MSTFHPIEYQKPTKVEEAVSMLINSGGKAKAIAGGTDLLVQKPAEVKVLVDLTKLNLGFIENTAAGIKIGAITKIRELERSPILQKDPYSVIAKAARSIGSVQIRNLATVGGNLCNASPAADMPPAFIALGAEVNIAGDSGGKQVPLTSFFADVNKTILKPGEILSEIFIPTVAPNTFASFEKIGRTALDLAIVNVAVGLTINEDGSCKKAIIALGSVGPTVMRAVGAEKLLKGNMLKSKLIERVASVAAKEAQPIDDIRATASYRKGLVEYLTNKAISDIRAMI